MATTAEQAIHDIVKRLEVSWNANDSQGFAASFVEDANFIHIVGGQLDRQAGIEVAHRHIFVTIYRGSHANFGIRTIRFLRPDVAVVFARAHVKFREGNESARNRNPPNVGRGRSLALPPLGRIKLVQNTQSRETASRVKLFCLLLRSALRWSGLFFVESNRFRRHAEIFADLRIGMQ